MMKVHRKTPQFWVVEKPPGWTVHNESPSIKEELDPQLSDYHFLNRLDKETSGLVLVSLSGHHQSLQEAWQNEGTRKIYFALHRSPRRELPTLQDWSEPLTDKAEGFKNPQGQANQRVACSSRFHLLDHNQYFILSAIEITTGRQHQIRKHSCLHGLELVGDTRYGEPKYQKKLKGHYPDLRLMLHCSWISLSDGEKPTRLVSLLPQDFENLFPDSQTKAQLFLDSL